MMFIFPYFLPDLGKFKTDENLKYPPPQNQFLAVALSQKPGNGDFLPNRHIRYMVKFLAILKIMYQ